MPLISLKTAQLDGIKRLHLYIPLLAYAACVFFLALAGYQVFRKIESVIQQDKLNDLNSIAVVKTGQIVSWREAQVRRGELFSHATLLPPEFEQWLREGAPAGARKQKIAKIMSSWRQIYGYQTAVLIDRQGVSRLAQGGATLDAEDAELVRHAMEGRKTILSDIHNDSGNGEISIDLAAPLIVDNGNRSRVVGVVLLRMNPADFLFPLIQIWPVNSSTAETLLVRPEGTDLLFLNRVRHSEGKAMTMRRPINTPDLPPGMFLRGKLDPLNSVDYRGVPVVASVARIPGTTWLMVTKIDKAELFAPIVRLKQGATIVGLVFLVGSGLLFFIWLQGIQTRYRQIKTQCDAALHSALLLKHFEYLTKYANDIIFVANENHEIIEANERAESAYGYSRDELLGMPIQALRSPTNDFSGYDGQMARLRDAGELVYETESRRKDGSIFPSEVSARIIEVMGVKYLQAIIRDITERKAAERRILRVNDLYAAINQTNAAIMRIKDQTALFQEICRIVVTYGHFRLAWIGLADAERERIIPVAFSGPGAGYLDDLIVSTNAGKPEGQGPTGSALHQSRAILCMDFETDPKLFPWRDKARKFGLCSSATWPLWRGGKVVGVLNLYADETNYFDDEMVALLASIAQDASFALDNLAMEESLRQSEERFRTLVENLPQKIFVKNANSVYISCNALYARDKYLQPNEIAGKTDFDFYSPALAEKHRDYDRRIMATGDVEEMQEKYLQDGQERDIQVIKAPFKNQQGDVIGVLGMFWDITERKREEALAQRFGHLLQSSFNEIYLFDASSLYFLETSEGARKNLGYSTDELNQMTPLDIKPSFTPSSFERLVAPLRSGEQSSLLFETFHRRKDGTTYPVEVRLQIMDANPPVFLAVIQDISERRKADEILRLHSYILRNLSEGICLVRANDGIIVFTNQQFDRMFGYETNELLGKHVSIVNAPCEKNPKAVAAAIMSELARTGMWVGEVQNIRKDGTTFWCYASSSAFEHPQFGKVWVAVHEDITERKRAEEALRESEARFRAMADNAPAIIWMADAQDGPNYPGCSFFNQGWHDFTGLTLAQTQGRNWLELVHPDDRALCLYVYQEAFRLAESFKQEYRLMRGDGLYRWMLDCGSPRFAEGGILLGFIGTVIDITEQKNSEAMRGEIERVGRLNIAVEMASGLAHELSQPLSAANNYLAGCLNRMKEAHWDKKKLQSAVAQTYKQTERAGNIINHLKELIRNQGHERTMIDINTLIRDTVNFIEHEIKCYGIVVLMELSPSSLVKVNKIEIEQVLLNLFKNAIEAMHATTEPVLRIATTTYLCNPEYILVTISDNGHGIIDSELTIFNPFQTSKKDGLGLGLSICRSLVENHGGLIWADAQRESGAVFNFTLPYEAKHE